MTHTSTKSSSKCEKLVSRCYSSSNLNHSIIRYSPTNINVSLHTKTSIRREPEISNKPGNQNTKTTLFHARSSQFVLRDPSPCQTRSLKASLRARRIYSTTKCNPQLVLARPASNTPPHGGTSYTQPHRTLFTTRESPGGGSASVEDPLHNSSVCCSSSCAHARRHLHARRGLRAPLATSLIQPLTKKKVLWPLPPAFAVELWACQPRPLPPAFAVEFWACQPWPLPPAFAAELWACQPRDRRSSLGLCHQRLLQNFGHASLAIEDHPSAAAPSVCCRILGMPTSASATSVCCRILGMPFGKR